MAPNKRNYSFQFKISLNGTEPLVWRRFRISGSKNLLFLHDVIQIVMGWEDVHLHSFKINQIEYQRYIFAGDEFESFENEEDYTISQLVKNIGQELIYIYDFGDGWHHTLKLEAVEETSGSSKPAICLDGERACPPEDVGNVSGYYRFLDAIADLEDPEHENLTNWIGGYFDPNLFNLELINERLKKMGKGHSIERQSRWYKRDVLIGAELSQLPDNKLSKKLTGMKNEILENNARKDIVTLLKYLNKNKVTGTASTGNFPLKHCAAIARKFVVPIEVERFMGYKLMTIQSEKELPELYYYHIFANEAGLIIGGEGRLWRLTPLGESFLKASPVQQLWHLYKSWWDCDTCQIFEQDLAYTDTDKEDLSSALFRCLLEAGEENFINANQILNDDKAIKLKIFHALDKDMRLRELKGKLIFECLMPLSFLGALVIYGNNETDYIDEVLLGFQSTKLGNTLIRLLAGKSDDDGDSCDFSRFRVNPVYPQFS